MRRKEPVNLYTSYHDKRGGLDREEQGAPVAQTRKPDGSSILDVTVELQRVPLHRVWGYGSKSLAQWYEIREVTMARISIA